MRHLKGFDFYKQLVKVLNEKREIRDLAKVFRQCVSKLLEKLKQMGYKILEEDEYGVIYLDTPTGDEYRARIKFEEGASQFNLLST